MDTKAMKAYRALNDAQGAIRNATTLDGALRAGLRTILMECDAQLGIIWYDDSETGLLHPYYWMGPIDLTNRTHKTGEGVVGRVAKQQASELYPHFIEADDPNTVQDMQGLAVNSMICVPFTGGDAITGCIQLVNKNDGTAYTEEEADVCEIMAMIAGMSIEENERFQPAWEHGETIMSIRDVRREFVNGEEVTKVLKGINLDVFDGEFLVLLGESGCGKSTLLNIIGGMDYPTSGSFQFMGEEFAEATQERLTDYRRDNIGFIFQSYNLMPNLNAKQNLELIASLVDDPMSADEALEIVNLGDRKNNYPSQMSGGQQQRVSIARALMKRPRLVLADEPTAALDYATSIEVLQVMERILESGTTLVMVTHNEEICRMADRVVRLRNGQVSEVAVNRRKAHATELVW